MRNSFRVSSLRRDTESGRQAEIAHSLERIADALEEIADAD